MILTIFILIISMHDQLFLITNNLWEIKVIFIEKMRPSYFLVALKAYDILDV